MIPVPSPTASANEPTSDPVACPISARLRSPEAGLVWELVMPYLRKPIPAPLSLPSRTVFVHPLATVMRVCKLFQSICEPLLYTHVVTDRFAKLISNLDSSSMHRCLARTRTMHIEYAERGGQASYLELCGEGGARWACTGRGFGASEAQRGLVAECEAELVALERSISVLNSAGPTAVFPKLQSIAVSSLYGRDTDDRDESIWNRHEQFYRDSYTYSPASMSCRIAWELFVESVPLKHYCMRDDNGPLRLKRISHASKDEGPLPPCMTTYHFSFEIDHLPLPLGRHINWVSDVPMMEDMSIPLEYFGFFMIDTFTLRSSLPEDRHRPDMANVDMYLSTSYASPTTDPIAAGNFQLPSYVTGRRLSYAHQEGLERWLEDSIKELMEINGWEKGHKIRWHASSRTPECRACGSGMPGPRAGQWATGRYATDYQEVDLTQPGTVGLPGGSAGKMAAEVVREQGGTSGCYW